LADDSIELLQKLIEYLVYHRDNPRGKGVAA
jgi:hypothetical protein